VVDWHPCQSTSGALRFQSELKAGSAVFQRVYLGTFCRALTSPVVSGSPPGGRLRFGVNAGPDFDAVESACWADSGVGRVCVVQVLEWRDGPSLPGRLPGENAGWNVAEAWACLPSGRVRLVDKLRFDLRLFLEGS
jgi:hypothetical protein